MAKVERVTEVVNALKLQGKKRGPNSQHIVGYGTDYGIYVHENLTAYHAPPTQAKFLEQPARTNRNNMAAIVRNALKRGMTVEQASYLAALFLLRESQKLVPVDTGVLRASGFVKKVKGK